MKSESCHCCREAHILHGAYVYSVALSGLLNSTTCIPHTVFPICKKCFRNAVHELVGTRRTTLGNCGSLSVMIDRDSVDDVLSTATSSALEGVKENIPMESGILYSNVKKLRRSKRSVFPVVPIAKIPRHILKIASNDFLVNGTSGLTDSHGSA